VTNIKLRGFIISMKDREILNPKTSNDELVADMLDAFEDVEKNGGSSCSGNLSHECVQDTVNMVGDVYEGWDDYTLIGGIPLQLKVLRETGETSGVLMREFGSRTTNDIDILTNDAQRYQSEFRDSEYSEKGHLNLDFVNPSSLPGLNAYAEEMIENSETVHVEGLNIDAEVRVPTDTDLFYTKIHDDYSRQSTGTRHDAEYMATSNVLDIDSERLAELTSGNEDAQDYLQEYLQF